MEVRGDFPSIPIPDNSLFLYRNSVVVPIFLYNIITLFYMTHIQSERSFASDNSYILLNVTSKSSSFHMKIRLEKSNMIRKVFLTYNI